MMLTRAAGAAAKSRCHHARHIGYEFPREIEFGRESAAAVYVEMKILIGLSPAGGPAKARGLDLIDPCWRPLMQAPLSLPLQPHFPGRP